MGFRFKGHLIKDVGAATMLLTSTMTLLNGTIWHEGRNKGNLCHFTFDWIQNGKKTCEPKAGGVYLDGPRTGYLPLWDTPKCNITVRAQLWDEEGNRMTDFEGMVYADGEKDV